MTTALSSLLPLPDFSFCFSHLHLVQHNFPEPPTLHKTSGKTGAESWTLIKRIAKLLIDFKQTHYEECLGELHKVKIEQIDII
jgi:hypothetical protein